MGKLGAGSVVWVWVGGELGGQSMLGMYVDGWMNGWKDGWMDVWSAWVCREA